MKYTPVMKLEITKKELPGISSPFSSKTKSRISAFAYCNFFTPPKSKVKVSTKSWDENRLHHSTQGKVFVHFRFLSY